MRVMLSEAKSKEDVSQRGNEDIRLKKRSNFKCKKQRVGTKLKCKELFEEDLT